MVRAMKNIWIPYLFALLIALGAGLLGGSPLHAKTINLCMDNRDWYPFTFQERKSAKGMHVDIVKRVS